MKNTINKNILGNIKMYSSSKKPIFANVGDAFYDKKNNYILIYDGNQWTPMETIEEKNKQTNREEKIDDLLDNDKFEPENFGFSGTGDSKKHIFKHVNDTYEIIQDAIYPNFYMIRLVNFNSQPFIYYRGKIPTNKFALEIFKNMNFGFLPIVHREMNISDLLD